MATTDEIRERWASRKWPSIGYFVHGAAYDDIQTLLAEIQFCKNQTAASQAALVTLMNEVRQGVDPLGLPGGGKSAGWLKAESLLNT